MNCSESNCSELQRWYPSQRLSPESRRPLSPAVGSPPRWTHTRLSGILDRCRWRPLHWQSHELSLSTMAFHYHLQAPLDHIDRESHDRAFRANKSIRCSGKCQTAPMWCPSNSTIYAAASSCSAADLMRHLPNGRWVVRYCLCPGRLHSLEESVLKRREKKE